jgi:hypothetical protein
MILTTGEDENEGGEISTVTLEPARSCGSEADMSISPSTPAPVIIISLNDNPSIGSTNEPEP